MQGNARKRAQFSIFVGIVGKATEVRQVLGGKKKARAKTGFVGTIMSMEPKKN